MEELVDTKHYIQAEHRIHQQGKRKQGSSAPDVPLGGKGIKASALLSTIHNTHAFNSAKAAKLEPEHPNFPLPLN